MSERKSNFLLPVIGGLIVIAGGVGAYLYFQGSPTGSSGAVSSAKIIPKQVLLAASISGNSDAWSQLEQFQTPEVKKYLDEQLKKFQQETLANTEIDFNQDIKPWAGDVMLAILPSKPVVQSQAFPKAKLLPVSTAIAQVPSESEEKASPHILLVVQVKDKGSALKFFDKVKSKAGNKLAQRDYKGVQISEFISPKGKPTSVAVIGDYSVLSPQGKSVEKAIDTFKGEASLASAIAPEDLELKNSLVQVYLPDFGGSVEQLIAMNPKAQPVPPQSLTQLKLVKSVTLGLGVDSDGLRLKGITNIDPNAVKAEYKPSPGKVIAQFPAETFALITGADIKSRWSQFSQDASKNPEMQKSLDEVRSNLKNSPLALDLDKDIFGWMDGEFAIGAINANDGMLAQSGVGPALIFQTSDRAAAESLLKKLDTFAQTNGLKIETKDVKGVSVTEWSSIQAPGFLIGHGWYEKDAFFFSVGSLINLLAVKSGSSLDGTPAFKAVTGSLQKSNIGYFYLDMDKAWAWYSSKVIRPEQKAEIPAEVVAVINTIRGIGATAVMPSKTTSKFELLLALKPKK